MGPVAPNRAPHGLLTLVFLVSIFVGLGFISSPELEAQASSEPDFTVVALPDTQGYSAFWAGGTMRMFTAQTEWVAKNKDKENIKAVIGLGDIINNYVRPIHEEWKDADLAYRVLDETGVPYAPTIGNHDYDIPHDMNVRLAKIYNHYFGPSRLSGYSWYGGGFPEGSNENFYITFASGTRSYLVIALEMYPRNAALEWAQGVVDAHPDKEVIIATHIYLNVKGKRIVKGSGVGLPADLNDGEEMWAKLVKVNKKAFMVLCGHVAPDEGTMTMGRRSDVGDHGNLIHQLLSDYQGTVNNGGNGYMRIMKFRPSRKIIEVKTYSPYLNAYQTDDTNQFTLEYPGTAKGDVQQRKAEHGGRSREILSPLAARPAPRGLESSRVGSAADRIITPANP